MTYPIEIVNIHDGCFEQLEVQRFRLLDKIVASDWQETLLRSLHFRFYVDCTWIGLVWQLYLSTAEPFC